MGLDDHDHIYMSSVKSDSDGFDADKLKFGTEITFPTIAA